MNEGGTPDGAADWGPWESVMKEAVNACVTRASGLADALSHKSAMSHRDFRNNAVAL